MATTGESSSAKISEDDSFNFPEPPEKPVDSDCCGTGCIPCVFDIYEEEMIKWRMECDKIKNGGVINSDLQPGDCDKVLSAFEFQSFTLQSITRLTCDSCLYRFNIPENRKLGIQIGQHLIMRYDFLFFLCYM